MARIKIPESQARARRRKRGLLRLSLASLGMLAAAGGCVYLAWQPFARIGAVSVAGAAGVATSTLEQFVRNDLAGVYAGVFPRDSALIYSSGRVAQDMRVAFPSLRSVSVSRSGFTGFSVEVSDRQPVALWCGSSTDAPEPCLYLDESGLAYGQAPVFSGVNPYPTYYGTLGGEDLPRQFLTREMFRALVALLSAMGQDTGTFASVLVDTDGDVTARFSSGIIVRFVLADDAATVLKHFTLALESGPFSSHTLADFEYLDLRFGERLYYKLK